MHGPRACCFGLIESDCHHVGGKFLITKNSQSLFEAELKPVAARHTIAGPVVKILMADNGFNRLEIAICRGIGIGQHIGCVENIEAFVFHRAHIEVARRDDHETLKI